LWPISSWAHQENCFCYQAALSYSGMPLDALGYSRASRAIGYPGHTQSKVGFFFNPQGNQFWAGYSRAILLPWGNLWCIRKIPCTKACPKDVTNIITNYFTNFIITITNMLLTSIQTITTYELDEFFIIHYRTWKNPWV
jgi:hypothetical protein